MSHRSVPQRLLGDLEQLHLFQFILRNPGIYLHELQHRLQEAYGVRVHVSTICRTLMGCTRQVIRYVALQQSEAMRAKFMAEVSLYDPSMLVWIDESGCNRRNSIRKPMATASTASILLTIEFWYEVLDIRQYL